MAFPGSLPPAGTASASDTLAAAGHTALHNNDRDEIRAIATKIGTGASTSTSGTVLRGTGAGTSAWGQVVLTTDVTGILPVANGGTGQANLTNLPLASPAISGTVSGSATYTTPTLSTPTIGDFTNANHGHTGAASGGQITSSTALADGIITPNHLASSASTNNNWVWDSFTPALTAVTTDPTLGTGGLIVGRYIEIGGTVIAKYSVVFGTASTNAGSGEYRLSLPVPANTDTLTFTSLTTGGGRMVDNSTGFSGVVFPEIQDANTLQLVYYTGIGGTAGATAIGSAAPWAWTVSDQVFHGFVIYEKL